MPIIRFFSILAIIFGILVIVYPTILAYIVAAFFIITGISGLTMSRGFRSYINIVK